MSGPTLFRPGNLEAHDYSPSQEELDKYVPLDYIMKWFDERVPVEYGGKSRKPIESPADRILILQSSTGSGKSTTIPPKLFHLFQKRTRKTIGITQPKKLTAIDIPKTILPYQTKEFLAKVGCNDCEPLVFGENFGYQTGTAKLPISKGVLFMTDGVLLAQLSVMSNEMFMKKYSFILIDECHVRSLNLDTILFQMKRFININYLNPECPFLVVMSATFDTIKYTDYLLSEVSKKERYKNIIKVRGLTYPIEDHFLDYDSQNLLQTIVELVIKIHTENELDFLNPKELLKNKGIYKLSEDMNEDTLVKKQKYRDILIFVKSGGDGKKLKKKIEILNSTNDYFKKYPILCLNLTGEEVNKESDEYKQAIEYDIKDLTIEVINKSTNKTEIKKPTRRVIFGTNVAETGISIGTLRYVLEPGGLFSKEFNPNFAIEALISKPVTQDMYKQRRGRVGRTAPGVCYALYTKETFDKMQEIQFPDIIREDITLKMLSILIREVDPENKLNDYDLIELFGLTRKKNEENFLEDIQKTKINIYNMDLLDLPPADSMHYAIEKLFTLGAINSNMIPTITGFLINKFRFITVENIKMILSGFAWKAPIEDLIIIAAFLTQKKSDIFDDENIEKYNEAVQNGKFTMFQNKKNIIRYGEYKTDLMMADDFIQFIILFNEFQRKISEIGIMDLDAIKKTGDRKKKQEIKNKNMIDIMNNWCEKYALKIDGLLTILETRDDIIDSMASMGLNPYQNYQKSYHLIENDYSDKEKYDYICNIKQCIFEGYKLNIAEWKKTEQKYYTRKTHIPIEFNSKYIQTKMDILKNGDNNPHYIIFNNILLMLNKKTNLYDAKVDYISVLDGFIPVDTKFDALG